MSDAPPTTDLHPWAVMVAPGEGENVTVARSLLSDWACEMDAARKAERVATATRALAALDAFLTMAPEIGDWIHEFPAAGGRREAYARARGFAREALGNAR